MHQLMLTRLGGVFIDDTARGHNFTHILGAVSLGSNIW